MLVKSLLGVAALIAAYASPSLAADEEKPQTSWERAGFEPHLVFKADVIGPVSGAHSGAFRTLNNLNLTLDVDLEKSMGWSGAAFRLNILSNSGSKPNNISGTLEGIDNIEVSRDRTKLFEVWLEQSFAANHAMATLL